MCKAEFEMCERKLPPVTRDQFPELVGQSKCRAKAEGWAERRGHPQLAELLDDARHQAGDFDLADPKGT